jgi:hypothetical protein
VQTTPEGVNPSGFNEMVSLTEKPCRFTLAGLFSFSAEDLS